MRVPESEPVTVRVRRLAHATDLPLPAYATAGAAGMDVRAAIETPVTLAPGERRSVPTGLVLEVPAGFEVQLRPRSGLAVRHGVTLANSPATIDSDYRGEIVIGLVHLGHEPFVVERGMRIAQLVLARAPRIVWEESDALSATPRAAGGFGHTGLD